MTREELAALPKGTTLFTICRSVSRSGMSRVMDVCYFEIDPYTKQPSPRWVRLSNDDAEAMKKWRGTASRDVDQDRKWGGSWKVGGCGMDMGWHLIYELSKWATGDSEHFAQRWL